MAVESVASNIADENEAFLLFSNVLATNLLFIDGGPFNPPTSRVILKQQ